MSSFGGRNQIDSRIRSHEKRRGHFDLELGRQIWIFVEGCGLRLSFGQNKTEVLVPYGRLVVT